MPIAKKTCCVCRHKLDLAKFRTSRSSPDGRQSCCQTCQPTHARALTRQQSRTRLYGLAATDYNALVNQQHGRCPICRRVPQAAETLCVDHEHDTGRIRGLLCRGCNLALDRVGNNVEKVDMYINRIEDKIKRDREQLRRGRRMRSYLLTPPAAVVLARSKRVAK